MIGLWDACKCGHDDFIEFEEVHEGNKIRVSARCNNCSKVLTDTYELEYIGRRYKNEN